MHVHVCVCICVCVHLIVSHVFLFISLQSLSDSGRLPKLFKEAVQYVLPKALLEPIYHFFYYCSIMKVHTFCDCRHYRRRPFRMHLDVFTCTRVHVQRMEGGSPLIVMI